LPDHYHYIITGAGCAGSSLLMRMMEEPFFHDKKILVIDQSQKTTNDRTWCFWEKQPGIFEHLVHHSWPRADFLSRHFSATLDLSPYRYKMIRGIDLYTHVRKKSMQYPGIEWRCETVHSIRQDDDRAVVQLADKTVTAGYLFNSILFEQPIVPADRYFLWQHFTGWLIETPVAAFNPGIATLMDFTVSQEQGTTFMYVLPISTTNALVEYTLFTEQLLSKEQYEMALREYITKTLGIGSFSVAHVEAGKIPMTNMEFPSQDGRILYMGIAGGQAKASSGYAFQFIQKRTQEIVSSIVNRGFPVSGKSLAEKKGRLYDSVLLHVLQDGLMEGDEIFARIFQRNTAEQVLCFLDNETNLLQDLRIMRSMPTKLFLPAALREIKKSI
jgi:lycopene beta-cyclase